MRRTAPFLLRLRPFAGLFVGLFAGLAPGVATAGEFNGTMTFAITVEGPFAAIFAAIAPNQLTVAVRGADVRASVSGGALEGPVHTLMLDDGRIADVDDAKRTATARPPQPPATVEAPQVVPYSGEIDILGYTCRPYQVTAQTENGPQMMTAWVTRDITLPDLSHLGQNGAAGQMLTIQGVEGVALKISVPSEQATVEISATSISTKKPKRSVFVVPKSYTFND